MVAVELAPAFAKQWGPGRCFAGVDAPSGHCSCSDFAPACHESFGASRLNSNVRGVNVFGTTSLYWP